MVLSGEQNVLAVSQVAVGWVAGSRHPHDPSCSQLFSALTQAKTPVDTSVEVHLQSFSSQGVRVVHGSSPSGLSVVVVVVVVGSLGSSGSPVGGDTLLHIVDVHSSAVFLHKSSAGYSGFKGVSQEQPPTHWFVNPTHIPVWQHIFHSQNPSQLGGSVVGGCVTDLLQEVATHSGGQDWLQSGSKDSGASHVQAS